MRVFKLKIAMLMLCLFLALGGLEAQPPPPPDPNDDDIPIGGSVPVGSGAVILVTLGVGYAIRKAYQAREKIIE